MRLLSISYRAIKGLPPSLKSRQQPPQPTSGDAASLLTTNNKGLCSPDGRGAWLSKMEDGILPSQDSIHPIQPQELMPPSFPPTIKACAALVVREIGSPWWGMGYFQVERASHANLPQELLPPSLPPTIKAYAALMEGEIGSPTWRLGYFPDSSHPIQPQELLPPSLPPIIKARAALV